MGETGHTILLVDDDVDFLDATSCILQSAGHRVVCCHDAASALDTLASERCDLVITDLMMNTLDAGFSLAEAIKGDPAHAGVPVIIATSASSVSGFDFHPRSGDDLKHMHADAFFDKPLPREPLLRKISELLNQPHQS